MTTKRKRKAHQKNAWKQGFSKALLAQAAEMVARGERLPLKDDVAFKMFLSGPEPDSQACLRHFLSAMTGREVTQAKVTNPELTPEFVKGKMPRLDVNCEFNDGQKADIELQLTKEDDDQKLRALFYACKLCAGSLRRGRPYKSMPSVYQIFLIDFDLFEEEGKAGGRQFFHRGMLRLDDGAVLSDRLQILFFDLKVPGQVDENLQKAANWCKFISGCEKPEVLEALGRDEGWKEEYMTALKTYMRIAAEERAWAYHLSTDRAEADYWNGIRLAKQAAREEGRKDERNKTARNMLADKLPPEKIAQYTGLSVEDIRALAAAPAVQGA
ncbi:MAG: Rpn family recombination-promoting nuclease/putative transposase [Treponema sp.]|nr:Rpn family recombination-promoting nuclease/putative transposase [Treponema sp.]